MRSYRKTSAPYLVWASIFIAIPVVMVLYYAFTYETGGFSLDNFVRFFSGSTLGVLWRSVYLAFISTVFCLVLGYPLAYMLSKMKVRFRTTALMLVVIPMWMNFLLRTYAWVTLLSKKGIINSFLSIFGIGPFDMLYTEGAVILGMIYNFLPFMVLPIYTVLEKMDRGLIEAAADLGCKPKEVFTKVIFPLSMPGVVSGISMVFIPAISTFEITALLGGNKTNLIGNVIEQQFTTTGDWNYGSTMAVVLMIFLVVSLIFTKDENDDKSKKKGVDHSEFAMTQDAMSESATDGEVLDV